MTGIRLLERAGDRLTVRSARAVIKKTQRGAFPPGNSTAASAQQPTLFGHGFDGPMEGHAPIMPASLVHWDLHVWLWKANPAGTFNSTNPALKCPAKGYTFMGSAPHMVEHH